MPFLDFAAGFIDQANTGIRQALLLKYQEKQRKMDNEVRVLSALLNDPRATDHERAAAVLGLQTLQQDGKEGSGFRILSGFATDPKIGQQVQALVDEGRRLGLGQGQQSATAAQPATAAPPAAPQGIPGFESGTDLLVKPIQPGGIATGGELAPPALAGSAGQPSPPPGPPEMTIPGIPQVGAVPPEQAGAAAQPIIQGGAEQQVQAPAPTVAAPPTAILGEAGGGAVPPSATDPNGSVAASTVPPSTAAPAPGPSASPSPVLGSTTYLGQELQGVDARLQGFYGQRDALMEQLVQRPGSGGIFGRDQDQLAQRIQGWMELLNSNIEQLEKYKQSILSQAGQNYRTGITQTGQNARTVASLQQQDVASRRSASARVQAARTGAETRFELESQRDTQRDTQRQAKELRETERKAFAEFTDARTKARQDLNRTLRSVFDDGSVTENHPPDPTADPEGYRIYVAHVDEANRAINRAAADSLLSMGADISFGQTFLDASGGSIDIALSRAKAVARNTFEELMAQRSIVAAYVRNSTDKFVYDRLLQHKETSTEPDRPEPLPPAPVGALGPLLFDVPGIGGGL